MSPATGSLIRCCRSCVSSLFLLRPTCIALNPPASVPRQATKRREHAQRGQWLILLLLPVKTAGRGAHTLGKAGRRRVQYLECKFNLPPLTLQFVCLSNHGSVWRAKATTMGGGDREGNEKQDEEEQEEGENETERKRDMNGKGKHYSARTLPPSLPPSPPKTAECWSYSNERRGRGRRRKGGKINTTVNEMEEERKKEAKNQNTIPLSHARPTHTTLWERAE